MDTQNVTKEELVQTIEKLVPIVQEDPDSIKEIALSFLEIVSAGLMTFYPDANPQELKELLIMTANTSYEPGSEASKIYGGVKVLLKVYFGIDELTQEEVEEKLLLCYPLVQKVLLDD